MECRTYGAAAISLIIIAQLVNPALAARRGRDPGHVGFQGIPVCPAGLPACGLHGCYTPLLSKCDHNNGCISVKILSQLSALVRFGSSAPDSAGTCPIPFANTCGDQFCGMGEVCSGGMCQSSNQVGFLASGIENSPAAAKAACQAARHGSGHCAGDASEMAAVECNSIGVASLKGIYCFQSQLFNCAVQPGGSATFTCRGIAGVAQAVTEVFNSTLSSAAAMAAEMADALAKQELQQLQGGAATTPASGQVPVVLASTTTGNSMTSRGGEDGQLVAPNAVSGDISSSSSSAHYQSPWRAGANAALGTLSNAVRDKSQPLLQPIFQNLADMVNNASKNLFNISADGTAAGSADGSRPAGLAGRQSSFNLGPPPIKDAAGALPQHTPMMLLVATLSAGLLVLL